MRSASRSILGVIGQGGGKRRPLPRFLTGFEQSRLSWARRAESYTDVPAIYHSALRARIGEPETFPYLLVTPSYQGFLTPLQEKLMWAQDERLVILDCVRGQVVETCYPFDGVDSIEWGTVLLQSWITVSGREAGGQVVETSVKFNSVGDRLFQPLINCIRPAEPAAEGADLAAERAKFDYLSRPAFKFMNYGRKTVRPGERVLATLWQPEIRAHVVSLFGARFYRSIAPAHLAILTAGELIIISDEEARRIGRADNTVRYGGVWTYLPLRRVRCEVRPAGEGLQALHLALAGGQTIQLLYEPANADALRALVAVV